jgi:transcription antitermination factor NusA-like protein
MMTFASLVNIKAIAVINYSQSAEEVTTNIIKQRQVDQLNIKSFSGLDLGYLHATSWLKSQLIK